MAYTITPDIQRMVEVGQKDIFMGNFDSYETEYTGFTTPKDSNKQTETYDSVGNLQRASQKIEGDAITYGNIQQAYQTSITNLTWANGFSHTMESILFDQYGVINSVKAKELANTMRELQEENAIYWIDNAFTANLADGVPMCSNSKPLFNVPSVFNDTLATAGALTNPDNHKDMVKMFANFKHHQNGPMKSYPNMGLTHIENMMDMEEVYMGAKKTGEISNTINSLPRIAWKYSTYMSSKTAYFMFDTRYEHILFQRFMGIQFGVDEDKTNTKNLYLNAIEMYNTGCLPNIGVVGNQGA